MQTVERLMKPTRAGEVSTFPGGRLRPPCRSSSEPTRKKNTQVGTNHVIRVRLALRIVQATQLSSETQQGRPAGLSASSSASSPMPDFPIPHSMPTGVR